MEPNDHETTAKSFAPRLPNVTQLSLEDVPTLCWDVIVVGAGPAGGAASAHLAANGLKVLMVDRARFPREKICGDGLVPEALDALRRIGLAERVHSQSVTLPDYTLFSPSGSSVNITTDLTMLQRSALDALIAEKAVNNGAVFAQAQFKAVRTLADGDSECTLDEKKFRCRILILAVGADLSLLRTMGFCQQVNKPDGVAIRQYFRSGAVIERPCFFLHREFLPGYAWIFPLGQNYYNVGGIRFVATAKKFNGSLANAFAGFLQNEPMAKELVALATESTPIRGASLRCGMPTVTHARQNRMMLAGESIGTTIPGWGEGVSKALETGLLAAEVAIAAFKANDFSKLQEYPKRLAREIKPKIIRNTLLTYFFNRPWTANLLVNTARRIPKRWL